MFRPPTMVCSTNRSFAGSPLGRNCFRKTCWRLGPLLPDDEYALWHAAQLRSKTRRPLDCCRLRPSSASVFGAGSPQPVAKTKKTPQTNMVARRFKPKSYLGCPMTRNKRGAIRELRKSSGSLAISDVTLAEFTTLTRMQRALSRNWKLTHTPPCSSGNREGTSEAHGHR